MRLANLSLKVRMFAVFLSVALLLLLVGGVGVNAVLKLKREIQHLTESSIPVAMSIVEVETAQRKMVQVFLGIAISDLSPDLLANKKHKIDEAVAAYKQAVESFEKHKDADDDVSLLRNISGDLEATIKFIDANMKYAVESDEVNRRAFSAAFDKELVPIIDRVETNVDKLKEEHFKSLDSESIESLAEADSSLVQSMLFVFVGGLLAMVTGYFFSRSLTRRFLNLAEGLSSGGREVQQVSGNVANASINLSEAATEQASALQQTVASLNEVSAMITRNAENARVSQQMTEQSKQVATRGSDVVASMLRSIEAISTSNQEVMQQVEAGNREIGDIVRVINEIGEKTKVINDIVFQTKLLSFNASVEAARAGEHGKGFAVVAEEVGNLAQMSGNASREISELLGSSIAKVEGIVKQTTANVGTLMTSSKSRIETGTETAKRCSEVLEEIVRSVAQVDRLVGEISRASEEQAQGAAEITKAMNEMDIATQRNAESSQNCSEAAERLKISASSLQSLVGALRAEVNGANSQANDVMDSGPNDAMKSGFAGAQPYPATGLATSTSRVSQAKDKARVIQLPKRANNNMPAAQAKPTAAARDGSKRAAGDGHGLQMNVPRADDPRFEDV